MTEKWVHKPGGSDFDKVYRFFDKAAGRTLLLAASGIIFAILYGLATWVYSLFE